MLFSVVMPTYERAQFLSRAIASVLAQVGVEWELVIVDNGVTPAIVPSDPRIRVIREKNQGGMVPHLNTGCREARGDVLLQLDDDDWLEPYALVALSTAFEDPEVMWAYGITSCENPEGERELLLGHEWEPAKLAEYHYLGHGVAWRKEAHDYAGYFDSEYEQANDYEFRLRLAITCGAPARVEAVVYHYINHPQNMSTLAREKQMEAFFKARDKWAKFLGG